MYFVIIMHILTKDISIYNASFNKDLESAQKLVVNSPKIYRRGNIFNKIIKMLYSNLYNKIEINIV